MNNNSGNSTFAKTPDRSLIAYAFLAQASRSSGGDLLSGLTPIFKPIAKIHAGKHFDPSEFAKIVGELYGLKVNAWAVEDLAPRLERAGLLVKLQVAAGAHNYVYAEVPEEFNEVTEKDIEYVIQSFINRRHPVFE